MSEEQKKAPFIKWGEFKSTDPNKPDVLEVKVTDPETFDTEYSTNAKIECRENEEWKEAILPLKSHNSNSPGLLKSWQQLVKKGKIQTGRVLRILTYLGTSKTTKRPIRRFAIRVG